MSRESLEASRSCSGLEPGRSSARATRLLIPLAVVVAMAADVSLLIAGSGWVERFEATSNGAFPGGVVILGGLAVGVVLAVVATALLIVRLMNARWRERALWGVFVVLLIVPWFLIEPRVGSYVATQAGLPQWGATINPAPIRAWSTTAVAPGSVPSNPPYWWYITNRDVPVGVAVPPGAVRTLVTGPLPDEVRVLPVTGSVIMAWVHSGSFVRYFVVGPPGSARPVELDSYLIEWTRVSDGVWTGVQLSH